MNALRRFLLFLGLAMFSFSSLADELRLMAWNVYMLPPPIIFSKQKERTRLQMSALKDLSASNDVLVISEAFQSRYKRHLLKEMENDYPYQYVQKRRGGLLQLKFMSSGIVVLSKFPLKFLGEVYYDECAIADCFASKAALLVELTLVGGSRVQILATHMQAGSKEKMVRVRTSQVAQIKSLLDEFMEPGVPQIVAGDLNIDSRKEVEFEKMISTLGLHPLADSMKMMSTLAEKVGCFGKDHSGAQENLDHILLRNNNSEASLSEEAVVHIRDLFSSKEECDLSDHHAVQSLLRLNFRTPSSQRKKTFQSPLLLRDLFLSH